ncbi:hypothetical protein CHS0354_024924 [Potamilus streckersoni]|uniref:XK-related protein n=1 Tax=Potamilus streckersoni TaxID=2493646 RepID=A0AAE0S4X0_9BIVA|nr:hypothetical protein CHS0354_024924 [Potamilus streckersoni]
MASCKKLPYSRRSLREKQPYLIHPHSIEFDDITRSDSVSTRNDTVDDAGPRRKLSEESDRYSSSVLESKTRIVPFHWRDILVSCSALFFFFFDIVTDCLLAVQYYRANIKIAFALTTVFIVGPSLVTCGLNVRWYWLDYQNQQRALQRCNERTCRNEIYVIETPKWLWIARFLVSICMMGPIIRYLEFLYNGMKSKSKSLSEEDRRYYHRQMRLEEVDACCLRIFECFLEAAPQLVLQLYLMISIQEKEHIIYEVIRALSIVSSWSSLAWCMVSYHKALRCSHEDKENMGLPGMTFYFLWRLCEIGPRVIVLGLFAAQFSYVIFIFVSIHWIIMSGWLFCQKTRFYQNRCEERLFNIVCGYVLVFCFLNVREGHTRFRALVYYAVIYIENFTMVMFWFYFTSEKSKWFYLPAFFAIIFGVVLQISFQLIYYRWFHPKGSGAIPCCLPKGNFMCYQSLCHSLEEEMEDQMEDMTIQVRAKQSESVAV